MVRGKSADQSETITVVWYDGKGYKSVDLNYLEFNEYENFLKTNPSNFEIKMHLGGIRETRTSRIS